MSKVLFATSNGTGLGHLSRAMAIARRLPEGVEPVLFTLSQAVPAVVGAGFRVEYHPSYRLPGSGSDWQWNLRLRRRLERLLEDERPDLVVFDGVHPYRGLTHVLGSAGAPPSIWCRRPLWQAGASRAPLRRTGSFDLVLEPGELAAERDAGPTAERRGEAIAVDPIVYLDEAELLPREQAASELGLDPGRTTALVNLGQGGASGEAAHLALSRLGAEPGVQPAALSSGIGDRLGAPEGVLMLDATFPVSRYLRAFDLVVSAAGYNAFHELVAFGVPALLVPMPRGTDVQATRSGWAAEQGAALAVDGPRDGRLEAELGRLLDRGLRERLATRCRELSRGNGAHAAARLVAAAASGELPGPRVRDGGPLAPLRRWLHSSAHPVGPSLPLALALTGRDLGRHPERRRPLGVVVAVGVADEGLVEGIRRGVDSLGLPAGRVRVVTDTLRFADLRRLGVGIERVPTATELGLDPGEVAYRSLLAERVERVRRGRRGPLPSRSVGPTGALEHPPAGAPQP